MLVVDRSARCQSVSLVEREGKTRSFHIANVTAATQRPIIVKHASRKSYMMTDEAALYPTIGDEFSGHGTQPFCRKIRQDRRLPSYQHGREPLRAPEARRVCDVPPHLGSHLHRHLAEFDFRANTRDITDFEHDAALLADAQGACGFSTDSLTTLGTVRQRFHAVLRWRACQESE